jgi:SAM-dependent methyltransferase
MPTPHASSPNDPADWFPLDQAEHEMQLAAAFQLADELRQREGRPARVLDLGAGGGRIASPLHAEGHLVVAIDNDPRAIDALQRSGVHAIEGDFLNSAVLENAAAALGGGGANAAQHGNTDGFDLALCLGNTFMTIHDVERAVALLRQLRRVVAPNGQLVIDAIATPMWNEVAEGYWVSGVSEDGATQLVWAPGDAVFAVRERDAMDPDDWHPKDVEPKARLWTLGCLKLLAIASGWGMPDERVGASITVFERPAPACAGPLPCTDHA